MDAFWSGLVTSLVLLLLIAACGAVYYFSVIVHELGHLAAARLVGWTPQSLCLGHGRRRTIFSAWGVDIQIGSKLSGGMANACANGTSGFRTKQFIFILGGPLATAGLGLLFFILAQEAERAQTSGSASGWFWIPFWVECWLLIATLWPRTLSFPPDELPSDGLSMWRTLWLKKSDLPALWLGHAVHRINALVEKDMLMEARAEYGRLFVQYPRGSAAESAALDAVACIPLFFGQKCLVTEALEIIERAIASSPDEITLQGTKGSLLIEAGDVDGGIEILEEVLSTSVAENDRAISTWYLALAYSQRGDEQAHDTLLEATQKYPGCIVAHRIRDEISRSTVHEKVSASGS